MQVLHGLWRGAPFGLDLPDDDSEAADFVQKTEALLGGLRTVFLVKSAGDASLDV